MLETLSTTLAANARYARLNGREHLVAPMTLIVPGVLAGSMGPLLYPPDEVSRNPQVWNEVPMVLYHPQDESGKPISAKTPGVMEKDGLGVVKRSIWNGKHVAEGWFDLAKLDAVDNRLEAEGKPKLRPRLERGEKIELSTGLFTENEEKLGEFNGKPYVAIARNYRPDHLAILPDQPGACSVNDGCGVNNEKLAANQERHGATGEFLNKKGSSKKQIQKHAEAGFNDTGVDETDEEFTAAINAWSDEAREAALAARKAMKEAKGQHEDAKAKLEKLKEQHASAKEQHETARDELRGHFDAARDKAEEHMSEHEAHTAGARNDHLDKIPQQSEAANPDHAAFGKQHEKVESLLYQHEGNERDMSHGERAAAAKEIHAEASKLRDMGAKLKGDESHESNYTHDEVKEMQGHLKALTERTQGMKDSAKKYKDARKTMRDIKQIATNQGVNIMGLSATERAGIITQITANCGCNDEDQKVLNGMSDAGLLRLKANAKKKESEDDDYDSEMEDNAGMGGKPDSSNADQIGGGGKFGRVEGEDNKGVGAERGKKGTNNQRRQPQPALNTEDQEALKWARDEKKRPYAEHIVANSGINDPQKRSELYGRLMQRTEADLRDQASYFPTLPRPVQVREAPAPTFLGNAGGPDGKPRPAVNHQDPDLLLDEPTVNWDEISRENRAINGGHGKKFHNQQVA